MENLKFRSLRADEVDARISTVNEKGVSLLLYKDARCDMNILDETVGAMGWTREHRRDNANCVVSIWDAEKTQWVSKEDTGTESYTEKEKGLASDSFKRACFNWGIGRELYTAPFVWISKDKCNIVTGNNGKPTCYDRFIVTAMLVENGKITALNIENAKTHKTVFAWGNLEAVPCETDGPFDGKPPEYKCVQCGKPFTEFEYGGRIMTPENQYKVAIKTRGKALCKDCYLAAKGKDDESAH